MTHPHSAAGPDARLLPCPFCGNTVVSLFEIDDFLFVKCGGIKNSQVVGCNAEGHKAFTSQDAIQGWNRRAVVAIAAQRRDE